MNNNDQTIPKIQIAPMLGITNSLFRQFLRMLTAKTQLYTEMVHTDAIINNGQQEILGFSQQEHPLVLQLGGNDPQRLAECAQIAQKWGYDEINLNVGCPSQKVSEGEFGACLMKKPELVAECTKAMQNAVNIPVTVKCRLGVDEFDSFEFTKSFIQTVSTKGNVNHFIIHARKAFLKGLDPKKNRSVPPLNYESVIKLKQEFPNLNFSINGGFRQFDQVDDILQDEYKLSGCMIGRAAQENPWMFSIADSKYFNVKNQNKSRQEILLEYAGNAQKKIDEYPQIPFPYLIRPIINIFNGENYNKQYREFMSTHSNFKLYPYFPDFIDMALESIGKLNSEALEKLPSQYFEQE